MRPRLPASTTLLLRASTSRRTYATALSASRASKTGIPLALASDGSPTAAITVALRAGSRYESSPGVAHLLKNLAFRTTSKRSALRTVREAELVGGVLTSSLTREHLFLTAEFLRQDEGLFAEILGDILTSSTFPTHEFTESGLPQALAESAQSLADPAARALDAAHTLAFRTGLGNSLFLTPDAHPSHAEAVAWARGRFASAAEGGIAVAASNVADDRLKALVDDFFVVRPSEHAAPPPATGAADKTAYHGGEARVPLTAHADAPDTFVLAFQGGAVSSPAYSVLRHALGGASPVKWSAGASPLSALSAGPKRGAGVQAFNIAYSDAGLFGFLATAPAAELAALLGGAVAELKKVADGALKGDALKGAVAKAKFEAADALETRTSRLELVGAHTLAGASVESALAALDSVQAADVAKAAQAALKSRPTAVAVGDTHKMPWADQIAGL